MPLQDQPSRTVAPPWLAHDCVSNYYGTVRNPTVTITLTFSAGDLARYSLRERGRQNTIRYSYQLEVSPLA